jgi:hypothetical protein
MSKSGKKRVFAMGLGLFCLLAFFSSEAFPWGFGTHTYIDDHLGKTKRNRNMDEIYGGVAPDTFIYLFDVPGYQEYLSYQTHVEFTRVWDVPRAGLGKALAFGFVSHNEVWGADSTAHQSGITFGQGEGYIIAKAPELAAILEAVPEYDFLDIPHEITLAISHELVEDGVDLLVKGLDPSIGRKLRSSAFFRTSDFPVYLVKAYAKDFSDAFGISRHEATKFIISSEKEFRKRMMFYGDALAQDDPVAVHLIAEMTAEIAVSFLTANGLSLPPGVEIEDIVPLIEFAIYKSMEICASDFAGEIGATIDFVNENLETNGISY